MDNKSPTRFLVTGACRSGKSRYALDRFAQTGGQKYYLATAEAGDQEMSARILQHQKERGASWTTLEEPVDLLPLVESRISEASVLLLDCLTLWISNLMHRRLKEEDIYQRAGDLAGLLASAPCSVAVVTNEVGWGVVPDNPLGRAFRDLAGRINQQFANCFDEVILMVSGLPVHVKRPANPE